MELIWQHQCKHRVMVPYMCVSISWCSEEYVTHSIWLWHPPALMRLTPHWQEKSPLSTSWSSRKQPGLACQMQGCYNVSTTSQHWYQHAITQGLWLWHPLPHLLLNPILPNAAPNITYITYHVYDAVCLVQLIASPNGHMCSATHPHWRINNTPLATRPPMMLVCTAFPITQRTQLWLT